MFRTSSSRWEELKNIQLELIASRGRSDSPGNVAEEAEGSVDDEGFDISEEVGGPDKLLRMKIDMATRW